MDNEQVYGKKVWEYPLAQAIEDGRAPDYRIVVPTLTLDMIWDKHEAAWRSHLSRWTGESDGPADHLRA